MLNKQKRELDILLENVRGKKKYEKEQKNINQYKPDNINNISSPTILHNSVDEDKAYLRGTRDSIDVLLRQNMNKMLQYQNRVNCLKYNVEPINNQESNVDFDATNNLYEVDYIVKDKKYCEKLFNNMTKRKNIVPHDPRFM